MHLLVLLQKCVCMFYWCLCACFVVYVCVHVCVWGGQTTSLWLWSCWGKSHVKSSLQGNTAVNSSQRKVTELPIFRSIEQNKTGLPAIHFQNHTSNWLRNATLHGWFKQQGVFELRSFGTILEKYYAVPGQAPALHFHSVSVTGIILLNNKWIQLLDKTKLSIQQHSEHTRRLTSNLYCLALWIWC